jgi:energy-coupling factor transport system ATP-binding protein
VWVPGVPLPIARGSDAASRRPIEPILVGEQLAIGRRPGVVVREGLDIALPGGRSTVLTGPNGAGKSTLALTLGGLLSPLAGRVGASPSLASGLGSAPIQWRSRDLLTRIGTVFQEPEHQFVASSVRGEVAVAPRALALPSGEIAERVDEVLARLRLDRLAGANPFTLSGGEQRRLSVAAVLVARPRVVILDEPAFGQDRVTWLELVRLLRELVDDGVTLLSVTHDTAFQEVLGDHRLELAASGEAVASRSLGGAA